MSKAKPKTSTGQTNSPADLEQVSRRSGRPDFLEESGGQTQKDLAEETDKLNQTRNKRREMEKQQYTKRY